MRNQIQRVIIELLERNEDGTLAEITETTQLEAAKLLESICTQTIVGKFTVARSFTINDLVHYETGLVDGDYQLIAVKAQS